MIFETILGSITTIAVAYLGNEQRKTRKHTKEAAETGAVVKAQVQNSHETNLRDDIDKPRDGIEFLIAGQATHTTQLSQVALDLGLERRERIIATERLDRHIDNHTN